jgi:4-hydroxy-tetrahydrodipicolinate reductase
MTNIAVCGAAGRMGMRIIALAAQDKELSVAGALEGKSNPAIGAGTPKITDDVNAAFAPADVIIDFTAPEATLQHLEAAVAAKKAIVIGTTGFTQEGIERIKAASRSIPVVFAPNMSMGVNILFKIAQEVARAVPGYDVEIVELHHNMKKDAPSGTAAKLAELIATSLDRNIAEVGVYGRHGIPGPRKKEEIGVMAVRAGDIVGDHTVYFAGPGERIELTHRAHSRDTFASGSLTAAKWLAHQKPGLYDMQDVLGLKNSGK